MNFKKTGAKLGKKNHWKSRNNDASNQKFEK